jgi:hypothetical protein
MSELIIDCNKPETYQVYLGKNIKCPWPAIVAVFDIVALFDTGSGRGGCRYGVTYKIPGLFTGYQHVWIGIENLREKPVWEPTPGKVYLFSDDPQIVGTARGILAELVELAEAPDFMWSAKQLGNADQTLDWKYCWPVPMDKFAQEAGE